MGKKKTHRTEKPLQEPSSRQGNLQAIFEAGRYRDIIRLGAHSLENATADPQLAFLVAASYFRLDEQDECLKLLLRIESQLSEDPGYQSLLGATYRRLGLLQKAENHLQKALAITPANNDIKNNFANLLIDLAKYDAAEQLLEEILREQPSHSDARLNQKRLATLRLEQQQSLREPPRPLQSSQGSLQDRKWSLPDPLLAAFDANLLTRRQQPPNSAASVQSTEPAQSIELPETSRDEVAREQLRLVSGMIEEGQLNTALELISAAHQSFTIVSPDVFLHAADIFTRSGKFSEAELCNLHAIALGNRGFACYANLVSLATMRGDCKLAAHYFKEAQAIDPEDQRLSRLRDQIRSAFETVGRRYNFGSGWHNNPS